METKWTVASRKSPRSPFTRADFTGTWNEAFSHAATIPLDDVYVVTTDDTHVEVTTADGRRSRRVTIRETPDQARARRAVEARHAAATNGITAGWFPTHLLIGDALNVTGRQTATRHEAALALAEAGWDAWALNRRHS